MCFHCLLFIISFIVELPTPNFSASSTCLNSLNSHNTLISITSSGVSLLPLTSSPLGYLDDLIDSSFFLYFNNPVSIACLIFSEGVTHSKLDRKSTRLNSSHVSISYAVFCLTQKKHNLQ